jgi:hypothetical protein
MLQGSDLCWVRGAHQNPMVYAPLRIWARGEGNLDIFQEN